MFLEELMEAERCGKQGMGRKGRTAYFLTGK